jgi:uncharacterized protein (DUF2132 family)
LANGSWQNAVFETVLQFHNFTISQFFNFTISQFIYLSMQPNNPLHGKTLESIVVYLVSYFGWEELGEQIPINCFRKEPSINSSLKFLRRTPWAREKVENLYLATIKKEV